MRSRSKLITSMGMSPPTSCGCGGCVGATIFAVMGIGWQSVEARTGSDDAARHRCHFKIRFGLASLNANPRRHAKRLARNNARRDESISKRNALAELQADVGGRTGRPELRESRPPGRPRLDAVQLVSIGGVTTSVRLLSFGAVNLEMLTRDI